MASALTQAITGMALEKLLNACANVSEFLPQPLDLMGRRVGLLGKSLDPSAAIRGRVGRLRKDLDRHGLRSR